MADLLRERPILKPGQLNALARDLLEGAFAQVWVQGEISNFSRPGSGHLYFTLKDERAQVRCALFRQKAMYLRFAPRDGMQVLVRGRLTLYEARGEYQLSLEHMEEAGEGALRMAFDALKAKLAAEGLFAVERKRSLPRFAHRVGVITSPTGAAVRDVISVFGRRFPLLDVEILPVPVQGEAAAPQIRTMLVKAAASGRYDALLLTRGGGSLEDLWAFNDEALVRAIAGSPVPVICAVGHETDFCLAEFAADLRAPTPSAAAELLVPDGNELLATVRQWQRRLDAAMGRRLMGLAQRNDHAGLRLQAMRPQVRLERSSHRLARLRARLDATLSERLSGNVRRLRRVAEALERQHPRERLAAQRQRGALLDQRLHACVGQTLRRTRVTLDNLARALHAVSPFATLSRGYAIVRDPVSGAVIRSSAEAREGQALQAQLSEGSLIVSVQKVER